MLRNVCIIVLAVGGFVTAGLRIQSDMLEYYDGSVTVASEESDAEYQFDETTQDLLAWVDFTEENSALDINEWMASFALPPVEAASNSQALLLTPGMSRQDVLETLGKPTMKIGDSGQWSYDKVTITFEDDVIKSWVETSTDSSKIGIRNVMMPLMATSPRSNEVLTWIQSGQSKPRIYTQAPRSARRANGYTNGARFRRPLDRLLDQRFRRGASRFSSNYRKPQFLQGMFGNRSSRSGSNRYSRSRRYSY